MVLAGILGGWKVHLTFGSYHEVDSSEMALRSLVPCCSSEACRKANPILLEPIMKVSAIAPDEYMGDWDGRPPPPRKRPGHRDRPGATQIDALVPSLEMFGYATDLRSSTQGAAVHHGAPQLCGDPQEHRG